MTEDHRLDSSPVLSDGNTDPLAASSSGSTATTAFSLKETSFEVLLGQADQACKECRRRKAKCTKVIPSCDLCLKYKRHCLYEKYSRTPLTRRHLTEVEERLERAEALLHQMRQSRKLPPHQRSASFGGVTATTPRLDSRQQFQDGQDNFGLASSSSFQTSFNQVTTGEPPAASKVLQMHRNVDDQSHAALLGNGLPYVPDRSTTTQVPEVSANGNIRPATPQEGRQENPLESPASSVDFEWNEHETVWHPSPPKDDTNISDDGGTPLLDGMASLSLGEGESGYLGVASGAALLRIMEPVKASRKPSKFAKYSKGNNDVRMPLITAQPNLDKYITDSMINAYFRQYHVSYPIIHEPTFRAQYCEVIPRPNGDSWLVLAYTVAALGVFCSATDKTDNLDLQLFARARSILSFKFLEMGNLTLVTALTLISNYQQKRDKPNSSYNYLGLAVRMALGLGLQKEFQGWNISPLNMETRRRIWWCLCVFDLGGTITFGRPLTFPLENSEVALPMNVNDRDLTVGSKTYPFERNDTTLYTHVRIQASFHISTAPIYTRIISKPSPSIGELTLLEQQHLEPWIRNIPSYWKEDAPVAPKFAFAHAVTAWRCRNLRIIMYRPIVVRRALLCAHQSASASTGGRNNIGKKGDSSFDSERGQQAYERCLADAKFTIESISEYWDKQTDENHNRLVAWYALYFLFQSALIPCICLRNEPLSPMVADWRAQITTTLRTIAALAPINPSAARSYQIIADLCGGYLDQEFNEIADVERGHVSLSALTARGDLEFGNSGHDVNYGNLEPIGESPQTQINNMIPMMWPNVAPTEAADLVMGDEAAWMEFLGAAAGDGGGIGNGEQT
ncbi:fungal-specific transcription factor domain-containing protein [Xylariaceae sp. FL0662B]|nr:fungal-specific transcription factor domain-containing protein [Xylariaceae sp. FL0662B]